MIVRVNVADIIDIARHRFVVPAAAAEHELVVRTFCCDVQEKLFDPGLTVGQTIGKQREVSSKPLIDHGRVMRLGIECVVHGYALTCSKRFVCVYNRIAAAISEYQVVTRDQREKRIVTVVMNAVKRCRCVDVPKHF